MTAREDLLHDLSDRLNGVMISVELAIALLGTEGSGSREIAAVLGRVREDCTACAELLGALRQQLKA